MESSPHLPFRSSRTVSPEIVELDRDSTIIIGTSAEDEEMRYSPVRQAPLNTLAKDSFDSYLGKPPPSSPTDTTPLTAFEKHETLPVLHDYAPTKGHVQTMLAPRTPPRSAQRSLNAPGLSPSRALSLPMTPAHRSALTDNSEAGPVTPHRATAAMAKRSAANPSARKVAPLPSATTAGPPTPRPGTKKRTAVVARHEDDYGADDERALSNDLSQANLLAATQSLPDLRASPQNRFPLSFLPGLIENQKKALKPPPPQVELSPTRSVAETEASSSMSLHSQEYRYYSGYAQQQQDRPTFRPLTQKPSGENPPGITVHSQSQSDHAYSNPSGDYYAAVERDYPGLGARVGTTLVAGTPSESSGSSQQERDLDMSQLYREGRSFMHVASQEELVLTQVVVHSQDIETLPVDEGYPATQSVDGDAEESLHSQLAHATRYPPRGGKPFELATHLLSSQSLSVKAVDVSPRKTKGFYSSSSTGTSIPGLSNPDNDQSSALSQLPQKQSSSPTRSGTSNPRPEYTPSKPAPVSIYQPAAAEPDAPSAPTRSNRPTTLRTSRPQNNNLPQGKPAVPANPIRTFGTATGTEKASKKPVATAAPMGVPKKNGLSRRKSPAPVVDQWLAEREAQMREEATAAAVETCQDEETAPAEEVFVPVPTRALKKSPTALPAKNGLSRRKSPAPAVDQWLLEREVHTRAAVVGLARLSNDEETTPVEDPSPHGQSRVPQKPAPTPRAKNGLSRRKSPAPAVDQWLVEREAQNRATEAAPAYQDREEETALVNDPFLSARNPVSMDEETQELPLYPRSNGYTLAGVTGVMMAGGGAMVLSEDGSVVMETDEEPLVETQSDAPVPEQSRWTNSPEEERPTDGTSKPKNPSGKKVFYLAGLFTDRIESVREASPVRATSTGVKRSNSPTISAENSAEWREESEDLSSVEDDDDDYKPQETQTQDDVFETQLVVDDQEEEVIDEEDEEDEEIRELFPPTSRPGAKKKRDARAQGGRNTKRVCRRTQSPKVPSVTPAPKTSLKSRCPAVVPSTNDARKAMLPPLDTGITSHPVGPPSTKATRATQLRGRAGSKAMAAPQTVGHLVLVRYADAKRFFLGYAVTRTGKLWEITPCDGSPTTYSELKNMRDGVFQVDDLVSVSANSGGEDCGDAIVIAVDQHWDEDRTVKVRIGGEEERYVAIRFLSVQERHIDQWNDRKVTHKGLESEDGMESMSAPTSALHRSTSFAVPTPSKSFVSSTIRTPQTPAGKIFSGIGFILTMCEPAMIKRLTDCGGYIYDGWLSAFKFGGTLEVVKGTTHQRWVRRIPAISHGKGKGRANEFPAVQWIGNEHEQRVKTLFVVAGKVVLTAKTLIALAFGIPCVSNQWIQACEDAGERVDWIPYLLPSHSIPNPFSLVEGALPFQAPDYQWGSDKQRTSSVLDDIMNYEPLAHRKILHEKQRVLYIAPACVEKLAQDYDPHFDSALCPVPFVYCCLAMGAQHVEAVEHCSHATDKTLLKYDLIVVADSLQEEMKGKKKLHPELSTALTAAGESGIMIINQGDFKMSIACGKLLMVA